MARLQN